MAFKDLLMVLTTYPDLTPVAELAQGVDFAAAIGAKISGVACEVEFQIPGSIVGNLLNVPALAAAESRKSSTNALALLTTFQQAAEKREVFHERRSETCLISEVADVLVEHARLRDLTIVPVGEGDYVDVGDWYVEQIVFGSGRPTLITPKPASHRGALTLNTVVVAWDFSRPAARAIADAIPILAMADLTGFSWTRLIEIIGMERTPEMPRKRHSAEQIVAKLRQIDVLVAQGRTIAQACKESEISEQSYYRWRNEYGGLEMEQAKRFKELERENARLKRLVADLSLEKQILKDVAEGNL